MDNLWYSIIETIIQTQNFVIGEPLTTSIVEYWVATDTMGIKYTEHVPVSTSGINVKSKKYLLITLSGMDVLDF